MTQEGPFRLRVHERGDARIDGILELIETASRGGEVDSVLQQLCEQVAVIAHAEVVSVYVREMREDGPWLVLRANVGFPRDTVGRVALRPGEGITGFAAEGMRPVSAAVADQDTHYKHVDELGEEHYPSFLSIPLVLGGSALGVLNLQRKEAGEFSSTEVALCTVLATPFALALDRGRHQRSVVDGEAPRSARLSGTAISPGEALGRAALQATFEGLQEPCGPGPEARDRAATALARVRDDVERVTRDLTKLAERDRGDLTSLTLVLSDQRLTELCFDATSELGVVAGLRKVARDYVAAPYRIGSGDVDPWLRDRAGAIEELCLWLGSIACDDEPPHRGAVWLLPERLSAFAVLRTVLRGGAGIVVGAPVAEDCLGARVARAFHLPAVADVIGLFAWARSGDTLLIDGDAGVVRVNPSASVRASHRHSQRP